MAGQKWKTVEDKSVRLGRGFWCGNGRLDWLVSVCKVRWCMLSLTPTDNSSLVNILKTVNDKILRFRKRFGCCTGRLMAFVRCRFSAPSDSSNFVNQAWDSYLCYVINYD